MFGTGKGFFGGLLALFFFSIIVFFVIYLLVPEVSIKFFGISVNSDEYVEAALEDSLSDLDLPEGVLSDIADYFSSPEGSAFVAEAQDAAGGAADKVMAFFGSDGFKASLNEIGEFVATGAGSVADFFSQNASEIAAEAGE